MKRRGGRGKKDGTGHCGRGCFFFLHRPPSERKLRRKNTHTPIRKRTCPRTHTPAHGTVRWELTAAAKQSRALTGESSDVWREREGKRAAHTHKHTSKKVTRRRMHTHTHTNWLACRPASRNTWRGRESHTHTRTHPNHSLPPGAEGLRGKPETSNGETRTLTLSLSLAHSHTPVGSQAEEVYPCLFDVTRHLLPLSRSRRALELPDTNKVHHTHTHKHLFHTHTRPSRSMPLTHTHACFRPPSAAFLAPQRAVHRR